MANFQVLESAVFGSVKYPLGNWPSSQKGFSLFVTGESGVEKIGIEIGQTLTLQLKDSMGLRIETEETSNLRHNPSKRQTQKLQISKELATSNLHEFTMKGLVAGAVLVSARDASDRVAAELFVSVGNFENHSGLEVDLIADVMRGTDSMRIHALQRMLHNNEDNIFNQLASANINTSTGSNLTCGMVAHDRGIEVFKKSTLVANDWYLNPIHQPLQQKVKTDRSNLRYYPKKVAALAQKTADTLKKGEAVRLAVVDRPDVMNPRNGKLVGYDAGGHTVLVVGCNKLKTEFLYIDPWFGGSKLDYSGGFTGNRFGTCEQIGLFVVERDAKRAIDPKDPSPNIIRQKSTTFGSFRPSNNNVLEVIAGPFSNL